MQKTAILSVIVAGASFHRDGSSARPPGNSKMIGVYTDVGVGNVRTNVFGRFSGFGFSGDGTAGDPVSGGLDGTRWTIATDGSSSASVL